MWSLWGTRRPTDPSVADPKRERRADRRRGRQDGRLRVPSYTHLSALVEQWNSFTTPYSEELWDIGRDRMQAVLVAYERRIAPTQKLVAGLRDQLTAAVEEVARGELAVADAGADLTVGELLARNPQEVGRGADVVRGRRMLMREKRIREERARQAARVAAVNELRRRIAETCQEMDQDFVQAQAGGAGIAERTAARVATYWGAVSASHSEGRQLALLLPAIRGTLPDWLTATSRCGVVAPPPEVEPDEEPDTARFAVPIP